MDVMDRRNVLRGMFSGLVVTGLGTGILITAAKAAVVPPEKDLAKQVEPVAEPAQLVIERPQRRILHAPHRRGWRRRQRVCWWGRHGRRVCAWR
jgi:hypothetical protein